MHEIIVATKNKKQVLDITDRVQAVVREVGAKDGVCHVFVLHTTAALSTADLDPGTDLDMLDAFTEMIPKLAFRHPHDPSHAPDHILATLIGASLSVPFQNGNLLLGEWQSIVLFEFDGPWERKIIVSLTYE